MADISFRTVMAIVEALADGSLYTTDTARAEALVVAPDSASLFWKCVVARPYTLENYNFCREKYGMTPGTRCHRSRSSRGSQVQVRPSTRKRLCKLSTNSTTPSNPCLAGRDATRPAR